MRENRYDEINVCFFFLLKKIDSFEKAFLFAELQHPPEWGGEVLPYQGLTGTCGPIGYGFQASVP